MKTHHPIAYIPSDDNYDWCAGCGYISQIVYTISPDGIEPMEPLCIDCAEKLEASE